MATFAYNAITAAGESRTGRVEADDRVAAMSSLEASGLVPVSIKEAGADAAARFGGRLALPSLRKGVQTRDVLAFVRQLGNLTAAGVPLARALQILSREASRPAAAAQWAAIHDAVADGASLADAMARHPKSFAPVHVAMVRAGEAGGFLDVVLKQIAEFIGRERELKGKVGAALIYPAVLATIATGVVIFLLTWFIPRFSSVFDEFGRSLPLLTRFVQGASEVIRGYGLFVLIAAVIGVYAVKHALKSEAGKRAWDRHLLRTPGIGGVVSRFALVRFARMLGTLLGAGVPMMSALHVARQAVGNQTLTDALDDAIADVQEGTALARSLSRCGRMFPPSVVAMIEVAEESGRLSDELIRMGEEHEQELDRRLRVLVALAEPALLVVMATLVGLIVVGMLLPVFDLWDAVQ